MLIIPIGQQATSDNPYFSIPIAAAIVWWYVALLHRIVQQGIWDSVIDVVQKVTK